jgi:hypothetical protein
MKLLASVLNILKISLTRTESHIKERKTPSTSFSHGSLSGTSRESRMETWQKGLNEFFKVVSFKDIEDEAMGTFGWGGNDEGVSPVIMALRILERSARGFEPGSDR